MTAFKFPELTEVEGKLNDRRDRLAAIFAEAGPELDTKKVKSLGDSADVVDEIRKLNEEMTELGIKRDELLIVKQGAELSTSGFEAYTEPGDGSVTTGRRSKSWVDQIIESGALTEHKGKSVEVDGVDLKATFATTAGWSIPILRTDRVVESAQRQPMGVIDLIPTTTTTSAAVTFMVETTYTNTAVEIAEGAAKPEAALALTEQTSTVRKIAVFLPVTDEQLEDEPRVRGYLYNRLPFMVRQRLSSQVLVGTGVAPNLLGVLNVAGIQTQAKGADPTPDAIYKAMVKIMTTGQANPNGVAFNPLDWQDVRLLRTADGLYIWGNPSEAGPERIWGLQVVLDQALTENTAVVADWSMTELAMRQGLTVEIGYNASDWTTNKQTLRAELRAAFLVYRPTAVCSVTGI